jgi:hypothetical protein
LLHLALIKAKAFLIIEENIKFCCSSSWLKIMRILLCCCGIVGRNYTWVKKERVFGCIQLMRKGKHSAEFSPGIAM